MVTERTVGQLFKVITLDFSWLSNFLDSAVEVPCFMIADIGDFLL